MVMRSRVGTTARGQEQAGRAVSTGGTPREELQPCVSWQLPTLNFSPYEMYSPMVAMEVTAVNTCRAAGAAEPASAQSGH